MKKIIQIVLLIFIFSVFSVGCQKTENYKIMKASQKEIFPIYEANSDELNPNKSFLKSLEDVYTPEYDMKEFKIEEIKKPTGIYCREGDILITDGDKDCIYAVDFEGTVIQSSGTTGNEKGEYLNPVAVTAFENQIYVLDQGNNRIQILDQNLDYVKEIALKDTSKTDSNYKPGMLAANENGIYVGGYSVESPVIDHYSEADKSEIGKNFAGTLCSYDGEIYAVNGLMRTYDKKTDSFGLTSLGASAIYKMNGDELEKVVDFPRGLFIADASTAKNELTCLSVSAAAVYAIGWDGKYKHTIAQIEGLQDEQYPKISSNTRGNYYVVLPESGKIVCCSLKTK
ncbi:MAG: hypothetical protein RR681_08080 [Lachnospiraceae bacterium]